MLSTGYAKTVPAVSFFSSSTTNSLQKVAKVTSTQRAVLISEREERKEENRTEDKGCAVIYSANIITTIVFTLMHA